MNQPRIPLKIAFVVAGISQRAASFKCQIPESRISAIVRGRETPLPRERAALASLLGRDERELFTEIADTIEAVSA